MVLYREIVTTVSFSGTVLHAFSDLRVRLAGEDPEMYEAPTIETPHDMPFTTVQTVLTVWYNSVVSERAQTCRMKPVREALNSSVYLERSTEETFHGLADHMT